MVSLGISGVLYTLPGEGLGICMVSPIAVPSTAAG